MATGTHAGSTWDTTAGNKTVVATPASGDLIVVVHGMSGWASGDTSVVTDNNAGGGGTYTQIGANPLSTGGGTAGALWISIRNALISSATSTTFTVANSGDTGGGLTVMRFSSVTRVGSAAARQNKGEAGTENPPQLAFPAATLTANPIVLGVFGEDNPAGVTPPSGFGEAVDTGWATPTSGVEVCWDDAGNTASSYAWSGGALTDHNEVGVEVDTSALASIGTLSVTLGAETSSATGAVSVLGVAASTLGALTSTAAGNVAVVGAATPALGTDTLSGTGTVQAAAAVGTLSVTLGAETASATGAVTVLGSASNTLGANVGAATGQAVVAGNASSTLGALTVAGSGQSLVVGTASNFCGVVVLSASGQSIGTATGTLAEVLGALTVSATGHSDALPADIVGSLEATFAETTVMAANAVIPWVVVAATIEPGPWEIS